MLADAYDSRAQLQRLRVHVPDRPGVLAGITQALGAERINIEDFELHHLSPERGGTLTLLVGGEDEAARAAKMLERQGYRVVVSPVLRVKIEPAGVLAGHIAVPGDKSISHRAVLLGSLTDGETRVRGFGRSADTQSTVDAMRALGVQIDDVAEDELARPRRRPARTARARGVRSTAGNAGTLMRLLAGLLAGQDGRFELTGDESLRARPMDRVAEPLTRMGARIETTDGLPPLAIHGSAALQAIDYALPVASAQVKSAILLAGLNATGTTTVVEPAPTRDHTELMLESAGARVRRRPNSVSIDPAEPPAPAGGRRPRRLLRGRAVHRRRDAARRLRADDPRCRAQPAPHGSPRPCSSAWARGSASSTAASVGGEWVGDIDVRSAELTATDVGADEVPMLVDELPLFALAAGMRPRRQQGHRRRRAPRQGNGPHRNRDEWRCGHLASASRRRDDGFDVRGVPTRPSGGDMSSDGDHRIAMLAAVAGLVSREGVDVGGAEAVAISFPGFFDLLESVSRR